jgi:hypothetical protein
MQMIATDIESNLFLYISQYRRHATAHRAMGEAVAVGKYASEALLGFQERQGRAE